MAAAVHPLGVPRTKGGQVVFEVSPEVADRVGGRWSGGGWAGRIPEVRGVGFYFGHGDRLGESVGEMGGRESAVGKESTVATGFRGRGELEPGTQVDRVVQRGMLGNPVSCRPDLRVRFGGAEERRDSQGRDQLATWDDGLGVGHRQLSVDLGADGAFLKIGQQPPLHRPDGIG